MLLFNYQLITWLFTHYLFTIKHVLYIESLFFADNIYIPGFNMSIGNILVPSGRCRIIFFPLRE